MSKPVIIGDCVLYLGDCLEVMKSIPDKSIDAVITDPPYGLDYQSNMRVRSEKFDILENDNNDSRLQSFQYIFRVMKIDSVFAEFASFKNYAVDYIEAQKEFEIKNCIVWNKGGGGIGDLVHSLSTDYELILICHKGSAKIRGKRNGSVWEIGKVNPNDMSHPTEKPTAIIEMVIDKWTDADNVVFDPFMGSGTTGVACIQTGRKFIGIEIDPKYFDIACKRIRDANQQMRLNI
jgi:site-specific DNA-methyltransferase (adenine-specific)